MRRVVVLLSVVGVLFLSLGVAEAITAAPRKPFASGQASGLEEEYVLVAGKPQTSAEKLLEQAKELGLKGAFSAARKIYQQVIEKFPDSGSVDQAMFWLAYTYEADGQHKSAVSIYGQLVTKYPESKFADDALRKKADIFRARKDSRLAAEALATLMAEYPASPYANEALWDLGELYGYHLDKFAAAVSAYRRYQADGRTKAQIELKIRFFENNNDYGGNPLKAYVKARRESEAGELAKAEAIVKQAIVDYPKAAVIDDALLLLGQNEVAKAIVMRKKHNLLDKELKAQFIGHYEQAARYFQQVIRDYPKGETAAQAQYYQAGLYDWDRLGGLNDFERAKKEYQAVIDSYPDTYWAGQAKERLASLARIF